MHYKRAAFLHPEQTPVAFALAVTKDLRLAEALAGRVGARVDQLQVNRRAAEEAVDFGLGARDLAEITRLLREKQPPTAPSYRRPGG